MNFKNLTNNEVKLLRAALRNAEDSLSALLKHDERDHVITTIPFKLEDVPLSYGELDLLLLHVICALNYEEEGRAEEC